MTGKVFQRKTVGIFIFLVLLFSSLLVYKNITMPKIQNFQIQQFETEKPEVLIGVISDTHIPSRAKILPKEIKDVLKGVDLIIHSGDVVNLETLKELEKIAPLFAVEGNMDFPETREKLPEILVLKIFNFKIGIMHSPFSFWFGSHFNWTQEKVAERLAKQENFDILIFGHTHRPYLKELNFGEKKILLINPGSPIFPFLSKASLAILKINKESFRGEIIYLKK